MKKLLLLLVVLVLALNVHALTKFDFLTIDRQECGIVSCITYYTATNPTTNSFTVNTATMMRVASKTDYLGIDNGFTTELLNSSNQWQDVMTISTLTITSAQKVRFRVRGTFTPIYTGKDKVAYSIDHVPSFNGYTFPEYDLWNQSYNKCFEANVTYNLGAYASVNETFPQRIYFNSTYVNLSTIRSDWGDLRVGKGTCGNVTSDYSYNFVYKNSTNAEIFVHLLANDIVNNTPTKLVFYYNNTLATHTDAATLNGSYDFSEFAIFTNDKSTDNGNSTDVFPSGYVVTTVGTSTLLQPLNYAFGLVRQLSANTGIKYLLQTADTRTYRFFGTLAKVRFNNPENARIPIMSMKNTTDNTHTGVFEVYIT